MRSQIQTGRSPHFISASSFLGCQLHFPATRSWQVPVMDQLKSKWEGELAVLFQSLLLLWSEQISSYQKPSSCRTQKYFIWTAFVISFKH